MSMTEYTNEVKLPHTELVIGRSGSGKTRYLTNQLESILNHNPCLVNIFIICPTIDDNKAFKTWKLPKHHAKKVHYIGCHHDEVNDQILIIMGKCRTNKGDEDTCKHMIVLDDCAQGKGVKGRTSPIVTLAFGARHQGIGIIILTQQLTSITKPFRDNLTRVVSFYTQSKQSYNVLYDEFLGNVPDDERKMIQKTLKVKRYSKVVIRLSYPFDYLVC